MDIADEVSVEVVGMGLRFDEQTVEVDLLDPHLPELLKEDFGSLDQTLVRVPVVGISGFRPMNASAPATPNR